MSKLTKIMHKIFGINADFSYQMGKFGSFKNGAPEYAANVSDIQSLANWETGLFDSVVANNAPLKEDINAALHHASRQIGYLYQAGIPEWDALSTYYIDSFVSYGGEVFVSLVDSNQNFTPNIANSAKWAPVTSKNLFSDYSNLVDGQSVPGDVTPNVFNFKTLASDPKSLVLTPDTEWSFVVPYTCYYDIDSGFSTIGDYASGDWVVIEAWEETSPGNYNVSTLFNKKFTSTETLIAIAARKIKATKGNPLTIVITQSRAAGPITIYGQVLVSKMDI